MRGPALILVTNKDIAMSAHLCRTGSYSLARLAYKSPALTPDDTATSSPSFCASGAEVTISKISPRNSMAYGMGSSASSAGGGLSRSMGGSTPPAPRVLLPVAVRGFVYGRVKEWSDEKGVEVNSSTLRNKTLRIELWQPRTAV